MPLDRIKPIVVVTTFIFLSACATHRTKVIDTPETRNLKGWQKPYEINGKRYEPLMSHQGFVEDGVASWYGSDFHGGPTSNGERYDMYAMTAAHKTLPLGVYVRVVNKRNDREAIVRVNDRGPFVKDRIIDLSYAAAKELDIDDMGTAPVHIEALGYRSTDNNGDAPFLEPKSYDSGRFSIQVGAFAKWENAQKLAARMKINFGASDIQDATVKGNRVFRVRVGSYASLAGAEKARGDFERSGYPGCFVVAVD
jgi:rare lipoprotein A